MEEKRERGGGGRRRRTGEYSIFIWSKNEERRNEGERVSVWLEEEQIKII